MTARAGKLLELNDDLLLDEDSDESEPIYYYYDIEENYRRLREERGDMPNAVHNDLVDYILQILRWQYINTTFTIHREINFYTTDETDEKPLYPDTFIIKSNEKLRPLSIRLYKDVPSPSIIIEVLSTKTASVDLKRKPEWYAAWGVNEYFVYDPRERKRRLKKPKPRLYGWQIREGKAFPIAPNDDGAMWSHEVESRLVPNEDTLLFYDKDGNLRLTEAEARKREAELANLARIAEQQARIAEQQARIEAERREKVQQEKNARLSQKLRELGIDPDKV
jgi:Uma2 family endonuclease